MSFFLDHWKGFSALGVLSLPVLGVFIPSKRTEPFGYHTIGNLFIQASSENQESKKDLALVSEFPLLLLDKTNHWKYCLPNGSKLKSSDVPTKASLTSEEVQDCKLDWWGATSHPMEEQEKISFLLNLMSQFLKLQHQINLIFLFHLTSIRGQETITEGDQSWLSKIKDRCQISESSYNSLKHFFTSSTPISKNCFISPVKLDVTLTVEENTQPLSLETLKKGTVTGSIHYSLSDYWGNLHKLDKEETSFEFSFKPENPYKFKIESSENNGDILDLNKLYNKYQKRELKLEDFCKKTK